jgi:DNA-binding MarR family transcriptional regulator
VKAATLPAAHGPATDLEARVGEDDHQALRLWLRLLVCANLVETEIRTRLRAEFGITLARFDLLAQLERSPDGLKMSELSRRLMVSGGNVTGLTDELESEGLVVREDDPQDRRAYTVKLTPKGIAQFRAMAQRHEGWVVELLSGLGGGEQRQVFGLLGKLKQHLAAAPRATRTGRAPGRKL